MKYIKKYKWQTYTEKMYWSIKKDRHILKMTLEKLGVPNEYIKIFVDQLNFYGGDILYISYNPFRVHEDEMWYVSSLDLVKYGNYKYMGEFKLTSEELKEIEFQKNTSKYNL